MTTRYVSGDAVDQLFARIGSGSTYWLLEDHLGSVRDIIDNTGAVKDSIAYDGYGNITSETNSAYRGRYTFNSREYDVETAFLYYRARYYSTDTGRWVTQDPLGFDAGDSNLYRYVMNKPTMARDPSGLFNWEIFEHSVRAFGGEKYMDWMSRNHGIWEQGSYWWNYTGTWESHGGRYVPVVRLEAYVDEETAAKGFISIFTEGAITGLKIDYDLDNAGEDPQKFAEVRKRIHQQSIEVANNGVGFYKSALSIIGGGLGYIITIDDIQRKGIDTNNLTGILVLALQAIPLKSGQSVQILNKQGQEIVRLSAKEVIQYTKDPRKLQGVVSKNQKLLRGGKTSTSHTSLSNPRPPVQTNRQPVIRPRPPSHANRPRPLAQLGERIVGNNCFAPGTPILTPNGEKPIESISRGDLVLSRDQHDPDGCIEPKVVEEIFIRVSPIIKIRVQGRTIYTTEEHPFYVCGKGWLCARELTEGDELCSHDGKFILVDSLEECGEVGTVYNIRVADFHTYFVGSREWGFSVWAHNANYVSVEGGDGRLYLFYEGGGRVRDTAGNQLPSFANRQALSRRLNQGNIAPTQAGANPGSLNIHGSMNATVSRQTINGMRQQLRNPNPQSVEAFWRQSVARDGRITIYEINGQRYIINGNHRYQAALAEGAQIPEWAIRIEQRPNYSGPLFRLDQLDWVD